MPKHEALTGSNLHEPKGVASAADNTVYTADGTGSGAWEVIFEEQTQLLSGTSSTITGLGDYAVIYITTPEISSSSNNNRWWEMQFGNSGGITSSAIYYSCGWFYAGIEDHPSESSLRFGLSYTSAPGSYVEQKCLNPAGLGVVTANVRWKERVDDNGHKRYVGFKVHVQE